MIVELREHRGKNIATGQDIYLNQYRVFVDGIASGYVSDRPGSPINLVRRFGPHEMDEIEKQVQGLLPGAANAWQVPDVPADMLEPQGDIISDDDFD